MQPNWLPIVLQGATCLIYTKGLLPKYKSQKAQTPNLQNIQLQSYSWVDSINGQKLQNEKIDYEKEI